jgi:hypothetical protein
MKEDKRQLANEIAERIYAAITSTPGDPEKITNDVVLRALAILLGSMCATCGGSSATVDDVANDMGVLCDETLQVFKHCRSQPTSTSSVN